MSFSFEHLPHFLAVNSWDNRLFQLPRKRFSSLVSVEDFFWLGKRNSNTTNFHTNTQTLTCEHLRSERDLAFKLSRARWLEFLDFATQPALGFSAYFPNTIGWVWDRKMQNRSELLLLLAVHSRDGRLFQHLRKRFSNLCLFWISFGWVSGTQTQPPYTPIPKP